MTATNATAKLVSALLVVGALAAPAAASNYALEEIPQAIPAADAAKLKAAGVPTTFALLEKAADTRSRKSLAKETKISERMLEGWVQMADVLRVKGIGPDVARLLAAVGVKTVAQLRGSDATKLEADILKVNEKAQLSKNPPSKEHLAAWIGQAKELPIVLK